MLANADAANAIVDWVVVELRSGVDGTVGLNSRPALLQRDGDVVGLNGSGPLLLIAAPGSYHVAVHHRNHLGIMTAAPVALSTQALTVNFTSAAMATYGTEARRTIGATQVLWAGDATFNADVKYTGSANDRDPVLTTVNGTTPNNNVSIYSTQDVNMNGQVKYTGSGNDRDPILVNVGSTTPNNTRTQQLA